MSMSGIRRGPAIECTPRAASVAAIPTAETQSGRIERPRITGTASTAPRKAVLPTPATATRPAASWRCCPESRPSLAQRHISVHDDRVGGRGQRLEQADKVWQLALEDVVQ